MIIHYGVRAPAGIQHHNNIEEKKYPTGLLNKRIQGVEGSGVQVKNILTG
jgi:hypothetical protein